MLSPAVIGERTNSTQLTLIIRLFILLYLVYVSIKIHGLKKKHSKFLHKWILPNAPIPKLQRKTSVTRPLVSIVNIYQDLHVALRIFIPSEMSKRNE